MVEAACKCVDVLFPFPRCAHRELSGDTCMYVCLVGATRLPDLAQHLTLGIHIHACMQGTPAWGLCHTYHSFAHLIHACAHAPDR